MKDLVIGMAGSGGDGIVSAGDAMMTAAALQGWSALLTKSFGPQIRGGESSCRVRLSTEAALSSGGTLDVAVVLNWDDFLKFGSELPVDGRTTVVYDAATGVAPDKLPLPGVVPKEAIAVPIAQMAKATAGTEKAKNSVVLGLLAGWLGMQQEAFLKGIRKRFGKKSAEVVKGNEEAFKAGAQYAAEHPLREPSTLATPASMTEGKLVVDGNDMCAAAALFAGCQFFGGYPITPSSEIMQFFGREVWKYGGTMLQAEDEIAGIGAVVGASFAGKKAMTATSGPGMSLKTEMLGLATIAELPLVCVNVQRGGPSTGLPTKSEQSDLLQACFSAHGDVLRPVLAPISVADTFGITVEAFNVAEQYQTPVILLSDQEIAQRKETVDPIDTRAFQVVERRQPTAAELDKYARYATTDSGVSPISHPGMQGGNYLASGIEHNEKGAPSASGEVHARMNDKRLRKLEPLKKRRDLFLIEGDTKAPLAIVSWGSVAGVAREAAKLARQEGIDVKVLVPKLLYPVAEEIYAEFFRGVASGLVVEQSHQGQLYRVLRMFVDVPRGVVPLAQSGSVPILPAAIVERLRGLVRALQGRLVAEVEPAG
ncbi:MAG TPA: 2-oxoacid:acceptor oxidoreductase subunit alpha [Vicinamibacteria bacterium]|nr:2-oxoacid:acceptor oxidoreductase subunit alpha [Vicinamibacteria bacterium]